MAGSGRCDNPMCSCDPCSCDECSCGGARLGELEQRVMDILWAGTDGELTGRDVADRLPEHAYTTVATVLDRLVRKELVLRRMDGRKIRFTPVGSPGARAAVLMRQAMEGGPDRDDALVTFAAHAVRRSGGRPAPGARRRRPRVRRHGRLTARGRPAPTGQIIKMSMNAMPMHITTWLRSSTQGTATRVSTVPATPSGPPWGPTRAPDPSAPLTA